MAAIASILEPDSELSLSCGTSKLPAFSPSKIQCKDSAEAYSTTDNLPRGQSVALEASTGQQDYEESTQRVKNSRPRPFAIRHADIEEEIVKRGVH